MGASHLQVHGQETSMRLVVSAIVSSPLMFLL
jgi:hypothetical protein